MSIQREVAAPRMNNDEEYKANYRTINHYWQATQDYYIQTTRTNITQLTTNLYHNR